MKAECFFKIGKISFETIPGVSKPCRRGESCACSDDDRIRRFEFLLQSCKLFRTGPDPVGKAKIIRANGCKAFLDRFQIAVRLIRVSVLHSMLCPRL